MKSQIISLLKSTFNVKLAKICAVVGLITSVIAVVDPIQNLTKHELVIKGRVLILPDSIKQQSNAVIRMPNRSLEERIDADGYYEFEPVRGKGEGNILIVISLDNEREVSKKLHVNFEHTTVEFDTTILISKVVRQPNSATILPASKNDKVKKVNRNQSSFSGSERNSNSSTSLSEPVKIARFGIVAYNGDKFSSRLASKIKYWLEENGESSIMLTFQRFKFENLLSENPASLSATKSLNKVNYICFVKCTPEFRSSVADASLLVAYVKYEVSIVNVRNGSIVDRFEILEQGPGLSEDKALAAADDFFLNALSTNYKLTL